MKSVGLFRLRRLSTALKLLLLLLWIITALVVIFSLTIDRLKSHQIESIVLKDASLERHRPGARMALIIPFTVDEISRVHSNLETSWRLHPPCNPTRGYAPLIDLVFYFHRSILSIPKNPSAVLVSKDPRYKTNAHLISSLQKAIDSNVRLSNCFGSVRFSNALLSDEEDVYPLGASKMFFKLFKTLRFRPLLSLPTGSAKGRKNTEISEQDRLRYHQAFYYMEPDNVPCRKNWLDRLYEESVIPGDFWMRGSIMRDHNPAVGDWSFSDHINGNSLYKADDSDFLDFVAKVEAEFNKDTNGSMYLYSYDIALDLVRRNRTLVDWIEYADIASKFQYTETVQNWYRTKVNATELCLKNPSTYLVHGREVFF